MPAYIQETGRSFPNPIKGGGFNQDFKRPSSGNYRTSSDYPGVGSGMSYAITFEDGGPGSLPMGKDVVHYIGDEEPTNVNNSGNERVGIYRFYRAAKDDHKYSRDPQLMRRDFGCENESWSRAAKGYNPEPRSGKPVFYIMIAQVPNSIPLKAFYSYWPDDTQLCAGTNVPTGLNGVGCGRNLYKEVDTLGYVFATEADAQAYCSAGETPAPIYEYLHPDPDHFYCIDPSQEVNLADNSPIPPAEAFGKQYQYLGIIGWGFKNRALDSPTDLILDIGKIGPTGQTINKSGWYDYSHGDQLDYDESGGGWSEFMYRQMRDSSGANVEGPPNVNGWGWPGNVDIEDNEALFEWSYGLSGAVKGAVPRFLGFEDMYDSQFVFYLYDTTFPWNGPIFSSQYILSNAQCCPNTTDPEGCPHCAPVWTYHSHFYEINSDVWTTTKTNLSIHDASSVGVEESFWTIDTDTPIIFFRYLTRTGDYGAGEKINGWDIVSVYYFGDELKCGIMELTWDNPSSATKNTFSYQQNFTSSDGGQVEVLAGYGIPNKSAFCGTYEFPKKISYWKVEIDPKALIPRRTMDEAKIEAVVGDDGEIKDIIIINGGRGYVNPTIQVMDPQGLDDFSPNDSADFMADKLGMDPDAEKAMADPDKEDQSLSTQDMKSHTRVWQSSVEAVDAEDKNKDVYRLKRAEVEISQLDDQGIIRAVRIVDPGAGYSQANTVIVHVVDPEIIEYEGVRDKDGNFQAGGKEMEETAMQMDKAWDHTFEKKDVVYGVRDEATLDDYALQPLSSSMDPMTRDIVKESMKHSSDMPSNNATQVSVTVPDSYIRAAGDGIDDDITKLCFNLPAECAEINGNANMSAGMPDAENLEYVTANDAGVTEFQDGALGYAIEGVAAADTLASDMSHLYGPFGKKQCIEMIQPKLYNITRWFDMPCAYLDTNEEGERKAFGWLPYKYCASKEKEATFRVSMEIEGYVGGSQGPAFMDFLKNMPTPYLMEKRPITTNAGEKTWKCKRSSIDGRCYRDPQDPGNMVFVPVGLDENTYDYNRSNFTELEQLQMWAGQNISSSAAVQTWLGHPTAGDPAGTPHAVDYTALTVASCTNGVPPNECWDTYVRGVNASDGPLTVYSAYDANGNGQSGTTYCDVTALHNNPCLALDKCMDASIAINPQRITGSGANARMNMGSYNGIMAVRNYLSGGVIALGRALRNYGNPFFDECNEEDAWKDGEGLNDIIFPKRL